MNKLLVAAVSASATLLCGTAFAGEIATESNGTVATYPLKAGGMLKSADGHRVGFVDALDTAKDGSALGAQVIVGSRVVHVPASTITVTDKSHFTTSLSYKEVERL